MAQAGAGRLLSAFRAAPQSWKTHCGAFADMRTVRTVHSVSMRPLLFMAPLAMLLLPSCEPPQHSDAGGKENPGWSAKNIEKITTGKINEERLAALDSVGKAPGPRSLPDAASDTCPVHHEMMKIREVPIVFEDSGTDAAEPTDPSAVSAFPFATEKLVSQRNALLPGETTTARVYQCSSCIAAKIAVWKMRAQPVELPSPK